MKYPVTTRYARQWRPWRLLAQAGLLCVLGVVALGCPRPVEYQPQENLVESFGRQQAEQRLEAALLRAVNPPIDEVEVTDEFLRYHVTGTTVEISVPFERIQRAEIFNNHWVYLWGDEAQPLARILFADAEDARTFADLFMSFRAYYAFGGSLGAVRPT